MPCGIAEKYRGELDLVGYLYEGAGRDFQFWSGHLLITISELTVFFSKHRRWPT